MDSPLTSIAVCLCLALCVSGGFAYESDQYLYRTAEVADSLPLMDARVNDALVQVAATWSGPRDDARFARAVYLELGGLYWVDHIERWANASTKTSTAGRRSIEMAPAQLGTKSPA